jgi:hypothetical protein
MVSNCMRKVHGILRYILLLSHGFHKLFLFIKVLLKEVLSFLYSTSRSLTVLSSGLDYIMAHFIAEQDNMLFEIELHRGDATIFRLPGFYFLQWTDFSLDQRPPTVIVWQFRIKRFVAGLPWHARLAQLI